MTSWIVLALTVRPSQSDLEKIIEALFYSFTIYFICALNRWVSPLPVQLIAASSGGKASLVLDFTALRGFVIFAFVVAATLGLTVSYLQTNDVLTKRLRSRGFTRRSSRASVWSDVFHDVDIDSYALVEFSDGRRLLGLPAYFSDTPEEGSLFLSKAEWVDDNGNRLAEINGPGILITRNLTIQTISFLKGERRRN